MIRQHSDLLELEAHQCEPFAGLSSTYALIARSAAAWGDATALSFFARVDDFGAPRRWSYRELLAEITRSANLLRRLGIGRQDVVAMVLPNLPEAHFVLWGGETAGIVFAVNPLLDGVPMGRLLQAAGARWLVTTGPSHDAEVWDRVEQALAIAGGVEGVLAVDEQRHAAGPSESSNPPALPLTLQGRPVLDFHAEVAREHGDRLNFAQPVAHDIALYLCTGGTTGLPKIARHTHRNETCNAVQLIAVTADLFMAPGRRVFTALPLFHVNAQIATGLAVFASGAEVVLGPPAGYRTPGLIPRIWEIVERLRLSSLSGVPTLYAALMQVPVAGRDLSSLSYAICGAAPLPAELAHRVQAATGLRIIEGYGLTETAAVASVNPGDGRARIGSVGFRLPWMEMQVAVLDKAGCFERWAERDEAGAIVMRGPNVMPGYLDPAHDRGAFFDAPGPAREACRWFNSGDLGRQDADGYFWLTGRSKELIIRGGHNINPKSIEDALAGHPAVALCAAVGRPDAHAGEVPVAYVQLRGGSAASADELLAHAAQHIGERAEVPKAIRIVGQMPLTVVGKIFKPALGLLEIESVVRDEAAQAGVVLAELQVEQDPRRGRVARWRAAGGDAAVLAAALGRHVFQHEPLAPC